MEQLETKKISSKSAQKSIISMKNQIILSDLFYSTQKYGINTKIIANLLKNSIEIFQITPQSDQTLTSFPNYTIDLLNNWKFQILKGANKQPAGFRFFDRTFSYRLYCSSKIIIQKWIVELEKRMIRWGLYDDYELSQKIGKGKFGIVFIGNRRKDKKKVAIKAFTKTTINQQLKGQQALKNEILILRQIKSQYVVNLIAVYQTQSSYYLILDYIHGKLLKQVISQNLISNSQKRDILYMLALGLNDLAKKNIVHRDIKPQNIIYDVINKKPIIIDFGLATFSDCNQYIYKHCGTPGFVAPQIFSRDLIKIYPIADVYALGIIFHLLIYNVFPYVGFYHQEIIQENKIANFNFQKQQYKKTNPETLNLLKKMLKPNPKERIQIHNILLQKYFEEKIILERKLSSSSQGKQQKKQLNNSKTIIYSSTSQMIY